MRVQFASLPKCQANTPGHSECWLRHVVTSRHVVVNDLSHSCFLSFAPSEGCIFHVGNCFMSYQQNHVPSLKVKRTKITIICKLQIKNSSPVSMLASCQRVLFIDIRMCLQYFPRVKSCVNIYITALLQKLSPEWIQCGTSHRVLCHYLHSWFCSRNKNYLCYL